MVRSRNVNWKNANLNNGPLLANIKLWGTGIKVYRGRAIAQFPAIVANCPEKARLENINVDFTPKFTTGLQLIKTITWGSDRKQHKLFIHTLCYFQLQGMALLIPNGTDMLEVIEPTLELITVGIEPTPPLPGHHHVPIGRIAMTEFIKLFEDVYGTEEGGAIDVVFEHLNRLLPASYWFWFMCYFIHDSDAALAAHTHEIWDNPTVQRMSGHALTRMRHHTGGRAVGNTHLTNLCNRFATRMGAVHEMPLNLNNRNLADILRIEEEENTDDDDDNTSSNDEDESLRLPSRGPRPGHGINDDDGPSNDDESDVDANGDDEDEESSTGNDDEDYIVGENSDGDDDNDDDENNDHPGTTNVTIPTGGISLFVV